MKRVAIVVLCLTACKSASSDCDLSTQAGIAAAFKKATGKDVPKDNSCMQPSTTFKGLVVTGMFANDRGCIGQGILVGCQINPPGFEAAAMAKAGWGNADLATRQKLAVAWLQEIDDLQIVETKPNKFPKEFSPVSATADGNTVVVELWTIDPAGMQPVQVYRKHKVVFAADGNHGPMSEIDRIDVR